MDSRTENRGYNKATNIAKSNKRQEGMESHDRPSTETTLRITRTLSQSMPTLVEVESLTSYN